MESACLAADLESRVCEHVDNRRSGVGKGQSKRARSTEDDLVDVTFAEGPVTQSLIPCPR